MIRAVTANLGCASPSGVGEQRRASAQTWAERVRREGVDLVFAQEVPGDWLDGWGSAYGVADLHGPSYRVRSALLWRKDVIDGESFELPTATYHGSYVAAAELTLPGLGTPVVAVSVHASPSPVSEKDLETWRSLRLALPNARPGAGVEAGTLFDSDMVLASLALVTPSHLVLAAGDLNECVAWDETHPGHWGRDFFANVTSAGLVSLAHRPGISEQRTAFTHDELSYQLDHVLASSEIAERIPRLEVDASWDREKVVSGEQSDHAPVWFEIN